MALFLLTTLPGAPPQRTAVGPGRTRITARPGAQYSLVDDTGKMPPGTAVKRIGNDLVIEGLGDERAIEIERFFTACSPGGANSCQLSVASLGGGGEPITPATDPIAALPDGSFLLLGAPPAGIAAAAAPIIAGSDNTWKVIAAGVGGLAIAGLAAGGGGGGGGGGADTTPPPAPTLTSKSVLNALNPTFTGTAEAGARVFIRIDTNGNGIDGADPTFETVAAADGTWRIVTGAQAPVQGAWPPGGLSEGNSYAVTVFARDASGNVSQSTGATISIDTIAPAAPVVDPIAGDGLVSGPEAANGVTISGSGEAGTTVSIRWGAQNKTGLVDASGRWAVLFGSAELPGEGASLVSIALIDAAGNTSPTVSRAVILDTVGPAAPAITTPELTNLAFPVISGTAEANAVVQLSVDLAGDGSVEAVFRTSATASGTWSIDTASAVADEGTLGAGLADFVPNALSAVQTDSAGNLSPAAIGRITRDSTAPSAPQIAAVDGDDLIGAAGRAAGVQVSGTVEAAAAGRPVVVRWGQSEKTVLSEGTAWMVTFAGAELPADGMTTLRATTSSATGVPSIEGTRNVTIDSVAPLGPTITSNTPGTASGPVVFSIAFAEPVAGFDATKVSVAGGTAGAFSGSGALYSLTVTPTADTTGTMSVSVAAGNGVTDLAGNGLASAGSGSQAFDTAVPPTVQITDPVDGTATGPVVFTFTFSEPVTGFAQADIQASNGALVSGFTVISPTVYQATLTPPAGSGSFTVSVPAGAANDLAGNPSVAAVPVSQAYQPADTTSPTVEITDPVGGTATGPVVFTFTFSEPVTGFDQADILVSAGVGVGAVTEISATQYQATLTPPAGTGSFTVEVRAGAANDGTGNPSLASAQVSQPYDTVAPTVAITDPVDGTATGPVVFTFTFSEPVTGFEVTDIQASNSAVVSGFTVISPAVYQATLTPPAGSGSFTVSVPAGAANDLAGNASVAAVPSAQPFAPADGTPPTVSITDSINTDPDITNGPIVFTFQMSEPVTDFDASDVVVSAGTVSALAPTGQPNQWAMTVTPPGDATGTVTVSVAAGRFADLAGNLNAVGDSQAQDYDTLPPLQGLAAVQLLETPGGAPVPPGGSTTDDTPQLVITLDAVLGAGERLELSRDGAVVGTFSGAGPAFTFDEATPLAPDTYAYTATLRDAAGNSTVLDLNGGAAGNAYLFTLSNGGT